PDEHDRQDGTQSRTAPLRGVRSSSRSARGGGSGIDQLAASDQITQMHLGQQPPGAGSILAEPTEVALDDRTRILSTA
ncbi:MAG: hypothetical protein ACRDTT_21150, partial [Pseudonocardiaceae bacterium]